MGDYFLCSCQRWKQKMPDTNRSVSVSVHRDGNFKELYNIREKKRVFLTVCDTVSNVSSGICFRITFVDVLGPSLFL